MSELVDLSASEQARLVRAKQVSARELAAAHIARIEALDGALNAMVVRDFERALADADAADAAQAAGRACGPLHGVPVSVKESYDREGLPTTAGQPGRRDHRAQADSDAVALLRAAGAILLGKTNVPLNLADWQSYNEVYGRSLNPWHPGHTPGGSSGGSAAAVAARFSALEIGSDIAGSVRVPAAFCGILGLKTTLGAISERGHGVDNVYVPPPMSVMGPFARSAADLALMFDTVSGGADPVHRPFSFLEPLGAPARIAVWTGAPGAVTARHVADAVTDFAGRLEQAGCRVERFDEPPVDLARLHRTFRRLLLAIIGTRVAPDQYDGLARQRAALGEGDTTPSADFARYGTMSFRDFWQAERDARQIAADWDRLFASYDFILTPVMGVSGIPIDETDTPFVRHITVDGRTIDYQDLDFWLAPASALKLPALSLPLGIGADGLPLAAQLIGPRCADRRLIAFADAMQDTWAGGLAPDLAWAREASTA